MSNEFLVGKWIVDETDVGPNGTAVRQIVGIVTGGSHSGAHAVTVGRDGTHNYIDLDSICDHSALTADSKEALEAWLTSTDS